MVVLILVGVLLPSVTILATVLWGWRNDTLVETAQERNDWEFEKIVVRFGDPIDPLSPS